MRRAVSWHLTRDTHAGRNNHTARLVVHVQHLGRLAIHRSRSNQNLVVCRIVNQGIGVLHRIVIRAKLSSNALFEISLRLAGIKFSLCVKRQNLKPTCLVNQFAIFHVNQINQLRHKSTLSNLFQTPMCRTIVNHHIIREQPNRLTPFQIHTIGFRAIIVNDFRFHNLTLAWQPIITTNPTVHFQPFPTVFCIATVLYNFGRLLQHAIVGIQFNHITGRKRINQISVNQIAMQRHNTPLFRLIVFKHPLADQIVCPLARHPADENIRWHENHRQRGFREAKL